MMKRWFNAIIILPFNALVVIPALALWISDDVLRLNSAPRVAIGGVLGILGLSLAVWTMRLFATVGKGTAAPWDPPQKLVVRGPYCHVRNPMITSVLVMLLSEYFILDAQAILVWLGLFFAINMVYFPLFEERGLANRFGADYAEYKRNVPRWIPRIRKWQQPHSAE